MDDETNPEPPERSPGAPPHADAPAPGHFPDCPASVDVLDPHTLIAHQDAHALRDLCTRALEALGARGELRVLLVDDARMTEEHLRHKGLDSTTDVLTFDLASPNESRLDADAIVCVDEARRQADARSIPLVHELLLYSVHAALHCLGYDDLTEAEADAMHQREDEVFKALGLEPAYRASAHPTDGGSA